MQLPTEPIGSLPRPKALQDAMSAAAAGKITRAELEPSSMTRCATHCSASSRRARRSSRTARCASRASPRTPWPASPTSVPGRHDPVRGRPRASVAAAHGRPVPLRDQGLGLSRRGTTVHEGAAQTGGHLRVGDQPHVSVGRSAGYSRDQFIADLVREATAEIKECSLVARSSRSTSRRRACRSSSIRRAACSARSSI